MRRTGCVMSSIKQQYLKGPSTRMSSTTAVSCVEVEYASSFKHAREYVHIYIYTDICEYLHKHICIYISCIYIIYTHLYTYVCIYIYILYILRLMRESLLRANWNMEPSFGLLGIQDPTLNPTPNCMPNPPPPPPPPPHPRGTA